MFTTEFEAEVEESESVTLHQYYREAMIQGYNFAFEVTVTQFTYLDATHLNYFLCYSDLNDFNIKVTCTYLTFGLYVVIV